MFAKENSKQLYYIPENKLSMNAVFCFGELLLRMSPLPDAQWIQQAAMPVYIGGAELNAATALARWNIPVKYCTALPDNHLSADICNTLSNKNIDISSIHFSGNRIGIYYLTQGADLKNTGVIYDRAHSAFSELKPGTINWDEILTGVNWFHFSAISPALNSNTAQVCKEAVMAAASKGITVSIDLNYRVKLWQWGKKPPEIMPELASYCDVIMGNIWSANTLLGIPLNENIHAKKSKENYLHHASETADNIMKQFAKCKTVAQTFRFDHHNGVQYYAALNLDKQYISKEYFIEKVTDKVGSGDCFMAGLIYGLYNQHQPQEIVDFAAAAAVGKMNETGDATTQTIALVNQTIQTHA